MYFSTVAMWLLQLLAFREFGLHRRCNIYGRYCTIAYCALPFLYGQARLKTTLQRALLKHVYMSCLYVYFNMTKLIKYFCNGQAIQMTVSKVTFSLQSVLASKILKLLFPKAQNLTVCILCDIRTLYIVLSALTLILLMWTIWRAPTNASKQWMGFNSAFKGLTFLPAVWEVSDSCLCLATLTGSVISFSALTAGKYRDCT